MVIQVADLESFMVVFEIKFIVRSFLLYTQSRSSQPKIIAELSTATGALGVPK